MDKLKKVLDGNDTEASVVTAVGERVTLGWGTRIRGFIICFVLGFVFSLLGSFFLFIPNKGLILFAVFYTFGNLLSIGSTCFLMGPLKQLKQMMKETRIIATVVMFVFMALTLCAALWWKIIILVLLFCLLQFVALTWYSISYIPFASQFCSI